MAKQRPADTRSTRSMHVSVTYSMFKKGQPSSPVPVVEGFAIIPKFEVHAVIKDPRLGPITVDIAVEVQDGRARARQVTVGTERPTGVGYNVLRAVPVRDIIATAAWQVLWRVTVTSKSSATLEPVEPERGEDALRVIKSLVGWQDGARRDNQRSGARENQGSKATDPLRRPMVRVAR